MAEARMFQCTDGSSIPVGTMFCIGRNYADHAREMNAEVPAAPLVFLKAPQAYVAAGGTIHIPAISNNLHHEVELVVVMAEDVDQCTVANALTFVAGYGVGVDCTLRDVQSVAKQKGEPWTLSKSFRESAPISSIIPAALIPDPAALEIELLVNSEPRQKGKVSDMERTVAQLIVYLAQTFGLRRGDSIFTGTPSGVAQLRSGDTVRASICSFIDLVFNVA